MKKATAPRTVTPQDQVFWYLNRPADVQSLREPLEVDVLVIGGGMSGLSAAQAFAQKGKRVALLEAYYCGAGASGKSSGFITPNSELSLSHFIERHGIKGGKAIWSVIESGVEHIRNNIQQFQLACDYRQEDSLAVANSKKALKDLLQEHAYLEQSGYQSSALTKKQLSAVLGSKKYFGGITYGNTFGINTYAYCQEMKRVLSSQGVQIYEETPVLSFREHAATTLHATVKAEYIIVCTDQFTPALGALTNEVYHAQTSLLVSQVLSEEELRSLFPSKSYMVWDTDLLYTYYRIANNRLLLGGSSLLTTYGSTEYHPNQRVYRKLTDYAATKFPHLDLQFEQMWPGLIGISKDIAPLCGRDKDHPSIFYLAAPAGLPIAAALGVYAADHLVDGRDDLKNYFSPYRKFFIAGLVQKLLGTKLSFALSNWLSLRG